MNGWGGAHGGAIMPSGSDGMRLFCETFALVPGYSEGANSWEGFRLTFSVKTLLLAPPGIAEKVQDAPPLPGIRAQPQTQALGPESAQISAAILSCSAFGAFWGSPWPP